MENNCVSLETAQKLKAARFPQDDSQLMWYLLDRVEVVVPRIEMRIDTNWGRPYRVCEQVAAAPTAQEIADQLPDRVEHEFPNSLTITKDTDKYWASYDHVDEDIISVSGDNISEALATLWLETQAAK